MGKNSLSLEVIRVCVCTFHTSAEDRKYHGVIWLPYMKRSDTGLALIPKLKFEHVYLTSFSKMKVDLAVRVCNYIDTSIYKYTIL